MKDNKIDDRQSPRSSTLYPSLPQQSYPDMVGTSQLQTRNLSDLQLRINIKQEANQGNYKSAVGLLNQLIARQPDSAIDYNNRGLMYLKMGNYEQAMVDFNQAIALNYLRLAEK